MHFQNFNLLNNKFHRSSNLYSEMYYFFFIIGAMAVKNKLKKIRKNKESTKLLTASEIKSEPIEVIEILDN